MDIGFIFRDYGKSPYLQFLKVDSPLIGKRPPHCHYSYIQHPHRNVDNPKSCIYSLFSLLDKHLVPSPSTVYSGFGSKVAKGHATTQAMNLLQSHSTPTLKFR